MDQFSNTTFYDNPPTPPHHLPTQITTISEGYLFGKDCVYYFILGKGECDVLDAFNRKRHMLMIYDIHGPGGTKKIWASSKLAEGVHNGRHIDTAEERDGHSTQP